MYFLLYLSKYFRMSRTIYSNASSLVIQKGEENKEKRKRGRPKRACGINMTFPLFPFQLSRAFHPFLAENSHLNQKGKPQKRDKKGEQAQRQHPSKVKSRLQVRLSQIHKLPPRGRGRCPSPPVSVLFGYPLKAGHRYTTMASGL